MAETKKSSVKVQVNDVGHPDESAPSATSKPVIITNRPLMRDTMVVDEDSKTEEAVKDTPPATGGSSKPKLQPLNPPDVQPEESEAAPAGTKPAVEQAAAVDAKPVEAEKSEPVNSPEPKLKTAEPTLTEQDEEDIKRAERERQLQEIADSKEFYLPINSIEKQKTKRFVVLGLLLSLLLIITWADIALDAGLVQISGLKPVTHFFST